MEHWILGVDTGGTYTDAVAIPLEGGKVAASAKALTTRADLAVGIAQAIAGLEGIDPGKVALACLSTTLAALAPSYAGQAGRRCILPRS